MAVVLLAVFPWAMYRAEGDLGCDLQEFIHGGEHVLSHRARHPYTALDRYLPSLDVACVLLTILPLSVTAALWYFFNVGTWFGLLRTVRDSLLPADDPAASSRGTMAAGILTLALAVDGFLIAAFHVLMIWLMVAGLAHASRDRHWKGGALLGLAIWLKLLPVLGAGYLLLKGKWRPAVIAVLLALVLDGVLSAAAFGWQGAWDAHVRWADWGAAGSIDRQMHGDTYINEDRITNQSLIVVLRRFLTARAGYPQLAMADLSPMALLVVTGCAVMVLGAMVLRVLWRPAGSLAPGDWAAEIAIVVLCTVWLSPVVWSYHLTAAVPALAVVMAGSSESRKRVISLVWLVGMALFAVPLARAAGHMLWASLFLGGALVLRPPRDPGPADARAI
jgi:hypothetical protein